MRNKVKMCQVRTGFMRQEKQIKNSIFSKDTSLNVYALLLKEKSVISL